jgi:hypothetical protein
LLNQKIVKKKTFKLKMYNAKCQLCYPKNILKVVCYLKLSTFPPLNCKIFNLFWSLMRFTPPPISLIWNYLLLMSWTK